MTVVQLTRQRCAGCRHSARAHAADDTPTGPCALCDCTGWLDSKPHTWRDDVTDAWMTATIAWLSHREAVAVGYATEMAEFEAKHPRPLLADFVRAMSPGVPIDELEALYDFDVCSACAGTGHQHERQDGAA